VQEPITDAELTKCMGRFFGRLTRRGHKYLAVNHFEVRRHHHILVRANGRLTRRIVRELWEASCPGRRFTHYCTRVKDVVRVARYVVRDIRAGGELAPEGFRGRLILKSHGFLAAPAKTLWADQRAEWERQRQERRKATSPAQGTLPVSDGGRDQAPEGWRGSH
jgi:hypothetical protein